MANSATASPAFTHEELVASDKWALHRYTHRIYWLEVNARFVLAYTMYLQLGGAPIPEAAATARQIRARLDFARLHWLGDPGKDQTIPEVELSITF